MIMKLPYKAPAQHVLHFECSHCLTTSLGVKDESYDFNKDNNASDWLSGERDFSQDDWEEGEE